MRAIPDFACLLARLDPIGVQTYHITVEDLKAVADYVSCLQKHLPATVWDEAWAVGGEYGASIIVHEIIEIRELRRLVAPESDLSPEALARRLNEHPRAHVQAIWEEHVYLRGVLVRRFGVCFEVATLVKANRYDGVDLEMLLESDIGVFRLESEDRVAEARQFLVQLGRIE